MRSPSFRASVIDVWRRYIGTVNCKLGAGAIVWYKAVNKEMLNYFYSSRDKRKKWKQQIIATDTTFKLTCSKCSLRYHKNTNCPNIDAPSVIPEKYKRILSSNRHPDTPPRNYSSSRPSNSSSNSTSPPPSPPTHSNSNNTNTTNSRSSRHKNGKYIKSAPRPAPAVPRPLEEVTCFHCDQKGHYANVCTNDKVYRAIPNKKSNSTTSTPNNNNSVSPINKTENVTTTNPNTDMNNPSVYTNVKGWDS